MVVFILIAIISNLSFSANLQIHISPDSIYVGTLTRLTISVNNLHKDEFPEYSDIIDEPDIYSVVERKLSNHSVDYILQLWETGMVIIPSISVQIKKNKQDIDLLKSDIIRISVLSSMNENNSFLRDIKPMYEFKLMNPYETFLYILIFFISTVLAIYLFKFRKINKTDHYYRVDYEKSIYQKTIRQLTILQLPKNINIQTTEEYYLRLSRICRAFISKEYFIRATEMTSEELLIYFQKIGFSTELINTWTQANNIADMSKYAGQIPTLDQFRRDKENFIKIIKSFHKIIPRNH